MNAEEIEGTNLHYILVKPDGFTPDGSYPLLVFLHGFGASMYDLASLAPALDPSGYVYAFPNAPYTVNLGFGGTGYSWSADRPGVLPTAETRDVETLLDATLAEVTAATGARAGNLGLGGFSQGAGLTLRHGLLRPEAIATLAVLSGFFRDAETLRPKLPAQRTQPVFLVHGRQDQMIPLAQAHETRRFLEEAGYPVEYHEYDMPHTITDAVLADLRPWLHTHLPPRR
ncbi:MAG TPA: dienelactone hydrolase family protein [Dehalococcoidia bacterium]